MPTLVEATGAFTPPDPSAAAPVAGSENYTIGGTHLRTPPSSDGRAHKLLIGLPYGYDREPTRRYPVLYVCDGYWDFLVVLGLYGPLHADRAIEEFIIVGLAYGNGYPDDPGISARTRDLVPTGAETLAGPSETPSARYLDLVVNEFAPSVESEYRTDGRRAIAGASIGGTFSIFALLRKPGFFARAIALSPCVAAGRNAIFRLEEEHYRRERAKGLAARSSARLATRLFLGVGGADEPRVIEPARAFDRQLESRRYTGLEKRFWVAEGETHATVKGEGFTRGLAYIFGPATGPWGPGQEEAR